jgi:hypothetical protein
MVTSSFARIARRNSMGRSMWLGWLFAIAAISGCTGTNRDTGWSGTFVTQGSPTAGRDAHTATLLPDGRVLLAGGYGGSGLLASAELYDPASETFSATGTMFTAREFHSATLLPDGQVLFAGGGGTSGSVASAELYDPATGTFAGTGGMTAARQLHSATLLQDGRVLITGGYAVDASGTFAPLATAELYDPVARTFTPTGTMARARNGHTATMLPNGQVLVAGGVACTGDLRSNGCSIFGTAELYDPATGTFTATGDMTTTRAAHTATLLPSGKVLLAGGRDWANEPLSSAELYDPVSRKFTATADMASARAFHSATLLPSGEVLVAGGMVPELYLPASATFTAAPVLSGFASYTSTGEGHTATRLGSGDVLLAGGYEGWCHQVYCWTLPGRVAAELYSRH